MLMQLNEKAPTESAHSKKPDGQPRMHQAWGKLLFIHWPIDENLLRPHVPSDLKIDKFDGSAWIAIVPFTMWDIRALPPYVPPVLGLNAMHELNVRTYVTHDNFPGVWFFSLDCNSAAAVLGARSFYYLPYYNADIDLQQVGETVDYRLTRTDNPPVNISICWTIGEKLPTSQPGSLEYFLTERYCLYSEHKNSLYRCRIYHEPWPLQRATLGSMSETMLSPLGIATPSEAPVLHYAEEIQVDIWGLKRVEEPK